MITAILDSGVDLILLLQSLGNWLVAPMEFFTFLGTENFYLLVLPIVVWSIDFRLGLRIGVMLLLSGSLNALLKWTFHLPRPYWYDARVEGLVAESSFGVPSGHSQNPVAIYGLIAAFIRRGWAWAVALGLIFLIGVSRIVLGVHFYLDVFAGWAVGALLLLLFLKYEERVKQRLDQQSFGGKILTALAASLGIILLGVMVISFSDNVSVPDAWVANALADQPDEVIDPLDIVGIITPAGSLFGLAVGAFWLAERGWFYSGGDYWKRGLRVLLGIAGTLIIWQGLGIVFPRDPNLISYVLRFLRYALTTFWISGLAPWVFIRTRLAEPPSSS